MSLPWKKSSKETPVFTRSKSLSWRNKESGKSRKKRARSLILTGSTSTTDSGYTSERSDADTLRGQTTRRPSVSSTTSRTSYMPNVCYHCQISQPGNGRPASRHNRRSVSSRKNCLPDEELAMTLESAPCVEHSPYSSLRQLFYDKEPGVKLSQQPNEHGEELPCGKSKNSSSFLTSWRSIPSPSPFTENRAVHLRELNKMKGIDHKKSLHLSLYGTPSYADFYVPVQEQDLYQYSDDIKMKKIRKPKVRPRVRSYDPSKFEKLLTPENIEQWRLSTNKCCKSETDRHNENCLCCLEDETLLIDSERRKPNNSGGKQSTFLKTSSTKSKSDYRDEQRCSLPWQKRALPFSKRKKKSEKIDSRFLAFFYDKLRTVSDRDKTKFRVSPSNDYLFTGVENPDNPYGRLFGTTYKQLCYLRSRLSPYSRQSEWICDGCFGCSQAWHNI